MRFAVVLALVGCSSPSTPKPTPPTRPPEPIGPTLGKPLAGPFPTLDAYCAKQPADTCQIVDDDQLFADAKSLQAPLLQLGVVYVVQQQDPTRGCAIALRTPAGWFVAPSGNDACREPSYIELEAVHAETTDQVLTASLDVQWHTNTRGRDGDAEANYTITTFCSIADHPACTPSFTSKCETQAPASDCSDRGYEATWKLNGTTLTLTSPSKDPSVPNGTHILF